MPDLVQIAQRTQPAQPPQSNSYWKDFLPVVGFGFFAYDHMVKRKGVIWDMLAGMDNGSYYQAKKATNGLILRTFHYPIDGYAITSLLLYLNS